MKNKLLFIAFVALFSMAGISNAMEENENGQQLHDILGNPHILNPELAFVLGLEEDNFPIVENNDPFDDGEMTPGQEIMQDQRDDDEVAEMVNLIDQEYHDQYNARKRSALELGSGRLEHSLAKSKRKTIGLVNDGRQNNNNNPHPVQRIIHF